jgi:hypothetical protein
MVLFSTEFTSLHESAAQEYHETNLIYKDCGKKKGNMAVYTLEYLWKLQ